MGKVRGKISYAASQVMYPDNEKGEARMINQAMNGHHRDQTMEEVAKVLKYNMEIGDLRIGENVNGRMELSYKTDRAHTGDEGEVYAGWIRGSAEAMRDGGVGMGDMEQKPYDQMRARYDEHMKAIEEAKQLAQERAAQLSFDEEPDEDADDFDFDED